MFKKCVLFEIFEFLHQMNVNLWLTITIKHCTYAPIQHFYFSADGLSEGCK